MDPAAGIGMVGRENELARLGELVTAVAAGRGGLGWVRGEPGIGKSALVDAMVTRAAASGCSVFRGVGDELAQAFPLRLMADCLGVSERSADERRARLARLLRGQVNGSGAVDPVLAASERILELVDRLCAEGPVVLVADDLQWADEPSLLVWNRLARAVDQIPLLLVGTSRPLPYRAVAAALWELVRERGGQALELGPLSDADVQRVAARIAGAVPGPLLRGELERAGGNPLYVGELVDALIRDGLVEVTGGVAEFRGDSGATPGSLTMAIGRRLRFPTAGTASVLRMAALLGSDVDLGELAIVSGRPVAALAGVAEEAITTGVIRAAGERLTFRHELIRQVLVEQISPAMRAWLHGHIARELAAAGNGMEVVARHLLAMPHIGDRWVSQWLSEVPESAMYAVPQVSAELLNRALSLIGVDDPRWEAMAARTAQVLFWLGRDEQAGRTAREVARHSTDPGLAARMNILVLRSAGRMGRREDVLPVATAPVDERVPLEYQARLGAWSAVIRAGVGQTAGARAAARTALSQGRRAGDPLAIGYALHAMTLVSDASSALSHIDEALAGLGDDPESMDLRLLLLNNRLTYLAVLGQWEEAENTLAPALVLAERAGTFRAAGLLATAAEVCYLRGGWDDALVHLAGVEPEFLGNRSNLNPPALGALIALHREERDTADAFLRAAGAPGGPGNPPGADASRGAPRAGSRRRGHRLGRGRRGRGRRGRRPAGRAGHRRPVLPGAAGQRHRRAAGRRRGLPQVRLAAAIRLRAGGGRRPAGRGRRRHPGPVGIHRCPEQLLRPRRDLGSAAYRGAAAPVRHPAWPAQPAPASQQRMGVPDPLRGAYRRAGRTGTVQPRHRDGAVRVPPYRPDPRIQHPRQAGDALTRRCRARVRHSRRRRSMI